MKNQEYKVLARKYRPQKFIDLIGQETLVNILSNSIINNRTAHSYVLTGVRGVGKTTTARIIAMSLNCKKRKKEEFEPCEICDSCNSIKEDRNIDVIEIDAASKTGVDDIREIIDSVRYKPIDNIYKIFIIDEVHMLSKNAFNALLKTLEEPPDNVKFIFATTEVKKIPITILSRCQRFDLQRVSNLILTEHLFKIAKLENIQIDKDAVSLIVRAADGSVRDALSFLDQSISNQNTKITSAIIIDMLGLADRGKIFDLLDFIFKGDASNALNTYNELYNSGADIIMIFDEMLSAVHFITQIKIAPNLRENNYIPELERERGFKISAKLTLASLGLVWQVLFKGYQELQAGFHLYQHGEMIILRLIYIYEGPSPEEMLKKSKENIDNSDKPQNNLIKDSIQSDNITRNKINDLQNFTSTSNQISTSINSFREFVELFYQKKEGILHSQLYNSAKLISFKEGELKINIDIIDNPHFTRTVGKLISKWTGRIWQVHSSTSNIGKSLHEEDILNQQNEIEVMKNNPEVKVLLEKFTGITIHSITDITETIDEKKESSIINKESEV